MGDDETQHYILPKVILYIFFHFLLIYGGLGVGVLGAFWGRDLGLGFWGWSFQLMGFRVCYVGPSGFFVELPSAKKLCDNESCEWEMPEVHTHLLFID